jgi:hypothetical protein
MDPILAAAILVVLERLLRAGTLTVQFRISRDVPRPR